MHWFYQRFALQEVRNQRTTKQTSIEWEWHLFTVKIYHHKICLRFRLLVQISVFSIRCYQCSTQTDQKGVDSCGAYKRFNASEHIAIECNSDESHMPGSFCMKVIQQGPRGFICKFSLVSMHLNFLLNEISSSGDGRWRHVIRRCASVADTGVTGVCNWGVYENGDYWEECYCSSDACNDSNRMNVSIVATIFCFVSAMIFRRF